MKLRVFTGIMLTLFLAGTLTLAFNIPPVKAEFLAVHEVQVGIKAGDWIKYDFTWAGYISGMIVLTSMTVHFLIVEGTNATVQVTCVLSNGKSSSDTIHVDITAGNRTLCGGLSGAVIPGSVSGFAIPANCTTGYSIYIWAYNATNTWAYNTTIAGETKRTYAEVNRTVVYTSLSLQKLQLTYYWDKQTGIMVEASATYENTTSMCRATETNMWEAPSPPAPFLPPFWNQWWFWTIVAVVIIAGAVYFLKERALYVVC